MLFREIMSVGCENDQKHIHKIECGDMQIFFFKAHGTLLLKLNLLCKPLV
jgi:hypothetical protein